MSHKPLELLHATADDASPLAALAAQTFRDAFASDCSAQDLALHLARSYGEPQQRAEIEDPGITTLLARQNGTLVAFAQVRVGHAPDCMRDRLPNDSRALELGRFYVQRDWHGRGVAQELMRATFRAARERAADYLWLGVFERNERAQAFYCKHGFERIGRHVFVVGNDPQQDWIMLARVPAA
jgi:ribosomal protein S18 acetylase RimI-like enzyme